MKKDKQLEIVKYNNKLKKRLNLSINDYIEYSQLYSSIELELKPADNQYGKFINIKEEELEYFHIYFDTSNEEQIRNYIKENEKVKIIKIKIDYQIQSFKNLFANCKCINFISFKKFNRINIADMTGMFENCSFLFKLNLSNFKTNNVTSMRNMFCDCRFLIELNLSSFTTSNVTSMNHSIKI